MRMVSFDQVMNKSLELTEQLVADQRQRHALSTKDLMELRQIVYPLISQYLVEEDFEASVRVLETLLPEYLKSSSAQGTVRQAEGSYHFSQKDINDGLAEYAQTQEFKSLSQSIQWGRTWIARDYHANAVDSDKLKRYLYKSVLHALNGGKREPSSDWPGCSKEEVQANNNLVSYHTKRIKALLTEQPDAFVLQETLPEIKTEVKKDSPKASDETGVSGESPTQETAPVSPTHSAIEQIKQTWIQVLDQARAYRQTVTQHERLLMETLGQDTTVDIVPVKPAWKPEIQEHLKTRHKRAP